MKKLSLDELKVDSYAVQVSEKELAEVKGGTHLACAVGVASLWVAVYAAWNSGSGGGSSSGGSVTITAYGSDSTRVESGGVTTTIYDGDSTQVNIPR